MLRAEVGHIIQLKKPFAIKLFWYTIHKSDILQLQNHKQYKYLIYNKQEYHPTATKPFAIKIPKFTSCVVQPNLWLIVKSFVFFTRFFLVVDLFVIYQPSCQGVTIVSLIQFPPEMDENWARYGLAKLGQISRLPNWQRMLFCAYTTQLLHSTGEVCWNNKDSYFIWFEFVCRNSGQIASRRSWKRSCLGLEYTSKCSWLALLWEPN